VRQLQFVARGRVLVTAEPPPGATPEAVEAYEREMCNRLLATVTGLARICVLKRCRRHKLCLGRHGKDLMCKRHHMGLGQARYAGARKALGWDEPGAGG
jgi:hypothetical protein